MTILKKASFAIDGNIASMTIGDSGINLDVPTLQNLGGMCMKILVQKQQAAMQNKRIITPEDLRNQNRGGGGGGNKIII